MKNDKTIEDKVNQMQGGIVDRICTGIYQHMSNNKDSYNRLSYGALTIGCALLTYYGTNYFLSANFSREQDEFLRLNETDPIGFQALAKFISSVSKGPGLIVIGSTLSLYYGFKLIFYRTLD